MRKIAIFVEGQTEMLFVDRLLQELANESGLAVEHAEASGGATHARRLKVLKQLTVQPHHRFYVLIVNCGGDSKVKSDILERYRTLQQTGYAAIVGLRDVYGQFRYDDVPRLRRELNSGLPRSEPAVELLLAVMEIEAWLLGEHTHFLRVNPELTQKRIHDQLHFDPARDDLEQRWHPAEDLDRIYRMAGLRYTKQRSNVDRTLDLIDFQFFIMHVARRFRDAERLVRLLKEQLRKGGPAELRFSENQGT
jgi:hypothetical protein